MQKSHGTEITTIFITIIIIIIILSRCHLALLSAGYQAAVQPFFQDRSQCFFIFPILGNSGFVGALPPTWKGDKNLVRVFCNGFLF